MRIVVAGCGSIGARHTMNLQALGVAEVLLTDPNPERLEEIARKYDVKTVPTLAEALKRQPQGVLICTPPHLHVPLALAAVRAGCHCFIEKPIADRIEHVDELLTEAGARGLQILVGYNLRYEPGYAAIEELLSRNAIGRLLYVRAEVASYLADWRPWQDYRLSYTARKAMGGGIILDASHELDLVRSLIGEVGRVFCAAEKLSELDVEVEDTAEITLWFKEGVLGSVHLDMIQRAKSRTLKLVGTEGTITFDLNEGVLGFYSAQTKTWERKQLPLDNNQTYVAEMKHFLACISGEELPRITGHDGKRALQIALAAKESSEAGFPVTLES